MHVEIWQVGIILAGIGACAALYGYLRARREIRELQAARAADRETAPAPAPPADYSETFRAISSRIAALEGEIPVLRAGVDGFAALSTRVAAMESNLPGIQDAFESYTDALVRKEKRDGERARRAGKTAAEAAAELVGAPHQLNGPGAAQAAPAPLPTIGALGTRRKGRN